MTIANLSRPCLLGVILVGLSYPMAACDNQESTAEKVGEAIEETGEEAGEAVKEAGEAVEDAAQ
ncbi:MAG TPA: hypothetical protein VED46_01260 [Alphaproteobacteria bacterium]|nr:hypothetical protein [Alphaproteobacteria bacterium]